MRGWLPKITYAAIIVGLIWVFFYLKDMHPLGSLFPKLPGGGLSGIAIEFRGAKLVGWSGGKKIWALNSKKVLVSQDRRLVTFDGLARGAMFQDGKPVASISAQKIVYNMLTNDVFSPGTVALNVAGGPSISARNIYWNSLKSKLISRDGVTANIAGGTVHGGELEADFRARELNVHKISGEFKPE